MRAFARAGRGRLLSWSRSAAADLRNGDTPAARIAGSRATASPASDRAAPDPLSCLDAFSLTAAQLPCNARNSGPGRTFVTSKPPWATAETRLPRAKRDSRRAAVELRRNTNAGLAPLEGERPCAQSDRGGRVQPDRCSSRDSPPVRASAGGGSGVAATRPRSASALESAGSLPLRRV